MNYVELKCKTNFTFLTGASHPEEIIHQAAHLKLNGVAITDKDGVYGIPKAFHCSKDYPDLKFIVGADVTLEDHPSITFLVCHRQAYSLLCRLLTESHAGREKGEAKLLWSKLLTFMEEPAAQGLIALPDDGETTRYDVLKDIFYDRIYLPLSRFKDGLDKKRTERVLKLSHLYNIPTVATNDVHYHLKGRKQLQDVLTSIRLKTPLSKAGFKLFSNEERHLKSPEEMTELFKDLPEAISNTLKIADQCTFSPSELKYRYPSEWIPKNHTSNSYLQELTWDGAHKRYPEKIPDEVATQIHRELKLISELHFADYFLTIFDIVAFAQREKILCQGRGSAANSVVCYCLGITAINPQKINLLFERFISAERGEPPDIDVDFEHERREEVIQYIYKKYGRHRAAMVSAVVTYRTRSSLREISKALGVDVGTASARQILKEFDKRAKKSGTKNPSELLERLSDEMHGFPRHLSIHSGGFTLSADPITEIVPVEPARMDGRTIIQWDKYDLDYLGLLKVDVLSLGMLSALRKSLAMIDKELYEIPQDDRATYAMIQEADTVGTFQIESRAQISMLGRLLPKNFYDLVVQVAIVRPGPTQGNMVHPYLKRRNGLEKIDYYGDKRVEKILGKTLGVPLFQEQVMHLAIELGGFKPGEADQLRRAVNAWRSHGDLDKIGKRLMKGLIQSGLPQEFAERIFMQIQGFASYGFPESHAASFALLAYASAYIKCHHPAEFACALINSQPMGFYSVHTLIDDAKRHGVKVLPLHPNLSQWDSALEEGALRIGFASVKGLAEESAKEIIKEARRAPFKNISDFVSRTKIRTAVLHRLAMANAFSDFGFDQRHTLWNALEYEVLLASKENQNQLNIFSQSSHDHHKGGFFKSLDNFEKVKSEYKAYGHSTFGHPMVSLRKKLRHLPQKTIVEVKKNSHGTKIKAAGLILIRQKPPTAKGVTFSTLEDETGFLDLILHPKVYEKYRELFLSHCFLEVTGRLQKEANAVSVLVESMRSFSGELVIEPHQYFVAL